MTSNPDSWQTVTDNHLKSIQGICLDIDDTLSTDGKLTSEAFNALWNLKKAGFFVVPVTGRPAGWCDHVARFWPVDAVVGENGAFTFFMNEGKRDRLNTLSEPESNGLTVTNDAEVPESTQKLNKLSVRIRQKFPHARWASDQSYREFDLAIDFCEDVPPWPRADIDALVDLCEAEGAHAKVSSIHVNTWFGDYDKVAGIRAYLESSKCLKSMPRNFDEWMFIGDSPNDEPMFKAFKNSVGVANLRHFLDEFAISKRPFHCPRWITQGKSGLGFCEMADRLLKRKSI